MPLSSPPVAMMMQQRMGREQEEEEDEEMKAVKPWETLQVTMGRLHSNLGKAHAYVTKILVRPFPMIFVCAARAAWLVCGVLNAENQVQPGCLEPALEGVME